MYTVTIKDVAKKAGVSVATVSRVLNGTGAVKEQTRQAVEDAIEALQYSPNGLGRNLRRQETKKILVVLSTISNQFYSRVVRGIEDRAAEEGYQVLLGTTRDRIETLRRYFGMLQTRQVDGAIFMSTHFSGAEEKEFLEGGYPIVCACEPVDDPQVSYVGINDELAAREAVGYLISCGHRKIALLCGGSFMKDIYGSSDLREYGYRREMEENGLPVPPEYLIREGMTYNSGKRAAHYVLSLPELPDAIFSCSDAGAVGLIRTFLEQGIRVPEDISVMGFDNTAMSEVYYPSVTTVSQPQYEIGRCAMELLLRQMRDENGDNRVVLPHEIVCRESTRNRCQAVGNYSLDE